MSPDQPHYLIACAHKLNPNLKVWYRDTFPFWHTKPASRPWKHTAVPFWIKDYEYVLSETQPSELLSSSDIQAESGVASMGTGSRS